MQQQQQQQQQMQMQQQRNLVKREETQKGIMNEGDNDPNKMKAKERKPYTKRTPEEAEIRKKLLAEGKDPKDFKKYIAAHKNMLPPSGGGPTFSSDQQQQQLFQQQQQQQHQLQQQQSKRIITSVFLENQFVSPHFNRY
jgi:hypothetical protein